MINKKYTRDMIKKLSKKNQISKDVVPYLDKTMDTLLIAIIKTVNDLTDPDDSKTLTVEDVKEALFHIDDMYGLQGMEDLELDGKDFEKKDINIQKPPVRADVSGSTGSSQQLDINLNINVEKEENEG